MEWDKKKGNAGNRTQNLLFTRQTHYHYATPPYHSLFITFANWRVSLLSIQLVLLHLLLACVNFEWTLSALCCCKMFKLTYLHTVLIDWLMKEKKGKVTLCAMKMMPVLHGWVSAWVTARLPNMFVSPVSRLVEQTTDLLQCFHQVVNLRPHACGCMCSM